MDCPGDYPYGLPSIRWPCGCGLCLGYYRNTLGPNNRCCRDAEPDIDAEDKPVVRILLPQNALSSVESPHLLVLGAGIPPSAILGKETGKRYGPLSQGV
jgi:hypothetical protein